MKQDKGRVLLIIDKTKYQGKCLALLNINQFLKLNRDHTKQIQTKIQRALRKIKTKISSQAYSRLCPTGSYPGKHYGTGKIHKLSPTDNIGKLPIRPTVSNNNTPTYQLAKYLAKLLSLLSQSDYTINSKKHFIEQIKYDKIPEGYQMMSFDVKPLFTSIPLTKTIEFTLERIYDWKEINTNIPKTIMKEMLLLCTKDVHFFI